MLDACTLSDALYGLRAADMRNGSFLLHGNQNCTQALLDRLVIIHTLQCVLEEIIASPNIRAKVSPATDQGITVNILHSPHPI